MKTWMCGVCVLGALLGSDCASDSTGDEPPTAEVMLEPFVCTGITGVYRIVFAKKSGNCAELPEQLARFTEDANTSALSPDCSGAIETSSDLCDRDEETSCAILDDLGAPIGQANLIAVFTQTSDTRIEGMTSISLVTIGETACTASYALIGQKIE